MQIKYRHIIILICSYISSIGGLTSQMAPKNPMLFDHYNTLQGFNASQVLSLKKTKDGYLWIGTEQGLMRYDGHNFKTYRSNPSDITTISSNYIRRMEEDKHGRLWITALPDLNVFDTKTGKCHRVNIPADIDSEKKLDIKSIHYDKKNDVMWLGTNKGLLYSQGKEVNLRKEQIPIKDEASGIFSIEIDDQGIFWLSANDGLWRYDPHSCTAENFHRPGNDPNVKYDEGFFCSYMDTKNHTLWIGSWSEGMMRFDLSTKKMTAYTFADKTKIQNGILAIQKSVLKDEDHILWVGTTDGVKLFDTKTQAFYDYKSKEYDDPKGLPGAGFCFEPTSTEGMWIGTFHGLHRSDPYKQNVKSIDIPLLNSPPDWILEDICFENGNKKDSILWFFVGYESFFRYDIVRKKEAPIPTVLIPYCHKVNPYTLLIDSKNNLWLTSANKGMVGYDLTHQKLILPNLKTKENKQLRILKIVEDDQGQLWLGTTSGMYIYHRGRNEIIEQSDIRRFLDEHKLSDYAFRFTIDKKGKVWIFSTQKYEEDDALYCFDPLNKKFQLFTQDKYPALKILKSLESISAIATDKLMITSFNGFCIVDISKDNPSFDLFETYNKKPLGSFTHITRDSLGNIWMSTDNGVVRFDPLTNTIGKFNYFNSNMGINPKPKISYSKNTNTVYFSQNLAVNSISINDLIMTKPKEIILSDIEILNYATDVLPVSGQILNLSYDQNRIDLYFSNLSFTNSQDNTYQYQIDQEQSEWTTMTGNHLMFNNLGYGNYLLRVKAENSFGLKSPNDFLLHINISPPFWKTWWFNGLIIAMISALIYGFFKNKDLQREKLDNLRHHIARDLHDDMGSTLSHIRMMSEREAMRKEAHPTFQAIAAKTAEVMSNMTEIIWSINPKNESLKNIIGKIQEFAIDTLEPQGIEVYFDIDDVPENIKLDPENRRHFYLIFKEAVNNTAKYSNATKVSLSFKLQSHTMMISIQDDGIGFDPLLISKGNGLKNMAKRAEYLNGDYKIHTNNQGTTISLVLKR